QPPHLLDPFMTLPGDAASKDSILFPVWKPGHWSLSASLSTAMVQWSQTWHVSS
ncbi:hypothetical protein IRJ41_020523, partial [Triplophysa rosa]